MKELKEIRFNEKDINLKDNLVRGTILPQRASELTRNIICEGDTEIEGAVFGHRIEVRKGNLDIKGAVFAQLELYIASDATGEVHFHKSVGSANSIVSRASKCQTTFHSDINAKTVTLYNAFVAGSIYADEVILENSVVIGGVFATQQLTLTNSMVGTFNSPAVIMEGINYMLLPSAFSVEPIRAAKDVHLYNLSLADLGGLYRGAKQDAHSGKIEISLQTDEVKSSLVGDSVQRTLRSYTIIGKVLAADLLEPDHFQNHFIITAAGLGPQLLKTYDLGIDSKGKKAELSMERIREFFFDIVLGKIDIQEMNGNFSLSEFAGKMS